MPVRKEKGDEQATKNKTIARPIRFRLCTYPARPCRPFDDVDVAIVVFRLLLVARRLL